MRAGGLSVKIAVWRNVQVGVSDINEPVYEEVLWKSTWAQMVARRGRELIEAGQVFAMTSYFFTCRYHSIAGIDPSYWIVVNGQKYNIANIDADLAKKREIVVEARVQDIKAGPAALAINLTTSTPDGAVGAAYGGFTLSASGGTSPYTFSVLSGALPAGLALNASTGAVSGTPTAAGDSDVTFRVTDTAGKTADLPEITITVA